MAQIFSHLKSTLTNIPSLEATQSNESFIDTVVSNAHQARFYSRFIWFKVVASVVEKFLYFKQVSLDVFNINTFLHTYYQQSILISFNGSGPFCKVKRKVGLWPGAYTKKPARLKNAQAKPKQAISLTRGAKMWKHKGHFLWFFFNL